MKRVWQKKELGLLIGISLLVGCLIHFPELLSLTDAWGNKQLFQHLSPVEVLVEIAYAAGSFWLLFLINLRFFRFNDPTIQMRWWTLGLSFCVTWLLSKLLGELFVFLHHEWNIPAIHSRIHLYLHPIRDLVIILIVNGTCYIYYLIRAHQAMVVQNSVLQAENSRNQYLALKNQLNPHMLFNSLNTLQSLVREQPDKAEDYIRELSRVLRYTLQENVGQTVTLREEMDFVAAYRYLMQMRYEENLRFEVAVDPTWLDDQLPPLSVQTLVENAIKHNEISRRKPLTIAIRTVTLSDEPNVHGLLVANNLQPRRDCPAGTGVGLANLSKRYDLLFGQAIQISEADGCFQVTLPLRHKSNSE